MIWKIFTYNLSNGTETAYHEWLEKILNGVNAENFIIMDKKNVAVYFQKSYDDTYDKFGKEI